MGNFEIFCFRVILMKISKISFLWNNFKFKNLIKFSYLKGNPFFFKHPLCSKNFSKFLTNVHFVLSEHSSEG